MADPTSQYLYGIHDSNDWQYPGWEIRTEELGHDPAHTGGTDYRNARHSVIARLNNGYAPRGTIPLPQYYEAFAVRVQNFVKASRGCTVWIIGNEMNHGNEWPEGKPIYPADYARCYTFCLDRILSLPGHEQDQVLIGAVAPYNAQTIYPGNPTGDWAIYLRDILAACPRVGGIALHCYSSSQKANVIISDAKMGAPFGHLSSEFRCYRDFMEVIPARLWDVPIYITETNPGARGQPWRDENTGWVGAAYDEIAGWNEGHHGRTIRCLALYCMQRRGDGMWLDGKGNVKADFMQAVARGLTWTADPPVEPEPEPPEPEPVACRWDEARLKALVREAVREELARFVWAPVEMD